MNSEGIGMYIRSNVGLREKVTAELKKAQATKKAMLARADAIAAQVGGVVVRNQFNIKSRQSIYRKLATDGLTDPHKLKDIVRTTIVVSEENYEKAVAAATKMANSYSGGRVKVQRPRDFDGYSGTITNFKHRNGQTYEIQVNTPRMIYAKEHPKTTIGIIGKEAYMDIFRRQRGLGGGYGHKLYEQIRGDQKGGKKTRRLKRASQDYYRQFR